ncbi:hypothetical protein J3459_011060 [Metarhizium acridum]|nr:hypothetical protein J3459_011060 [Metarhizium acridum]
MTLFLPVFTISQLTRAGHSILSFFPHPGDGCSLLDFSVSFNLRLILWSSSPPRLAAAFYLPPAALHNPSLTYIFQPQRPQKRAISLPKPQQPSDRTHNQYLCRPILEGGGSFFNPQQDYLGRLSHTDIVCLAIEPAT